jgi:hypothetical protein
VSNGKARVFYFDDKPGIGTLNDIDTLAGDQAEGLQFTPRLMGRIAGHEPVFTTYINLIECHAVRRLFIAWGS